MCVCSAGMPGSPGGMEPVCSMSGCMGTRVSSCTDQVGLKCSSSQEHFVFLHFPGLGIKHNREASGGFLFVPKLLT